jgi:hypothetical protein
MFMYAEPNNDSPLNTQAAALWANQEGTRLDISLRVSSRIPRSIDIFLVLTNLAFSFPRPPLFRVQEDGAEALQARSVGEEPRRTRTSPLRVLQALISLASITRCRIVDGEDKKIDGCFCWVGFPSLVV